MIFRSLRTEETEILKIFLYEAFFAPEGYHKDFIGTPQRNQT